MIQCRMAAAFKRWAGPDMPALDRQRYTKHTPPSICLTRPILWSLSSKSSHSSRYGSTMRHIPRILGLVIIAALPGTPVLAQAAYDPEARLVEMHLTLPKPGAPVANYVRAVRSGNLLFLAGHVECGEQFLTGKVGGGVTTEQAQASAKRVGLCLLATLKNELGDLRKVRRIVKVVGMVNATPDFKDHPKVVNGCSDLLVAVFGERGRHARSSMGMSSLPLDMTVEIEMVVEVEDIK